MVSNVPCAMQASTPCSTITTPVCRGRMATAIVSNERDRYCKILGSQSRLAADVGAWRSDGRRRTCHRRMDCMPAARRALFGRCPRVMSRVLIVTTLMSAGVLLNILPPHAAFAASANPIVIENQQPGTTSWQFDNFNKESKHEIEGYASLTSVN